MNWASCDVTLLVSGETLSVTGLLPAPTRLMETPLMMLFNWLVLEVISKGWELPDPPEENCRILRIDQVISD